MNLSGLSQSLLPSHSNVSAHLGACDLQPHDLPLLPIRSTGSALKLDRVQSFTGILSSRALFLLLSPVPHSLPKLTPHLLLSSLMKGRTILSSFPASASVGSIQSTLSCRLPPSQETQRFDLVSVTVILKERLCVHRALDLTPGLARFGLRFDSEVKAQRVGTCERKPQVCLGVSSSRAWLQRQGSLSQTSSLCHPPPVLPLL